MGHRRALDLAGLSGRATRQHDQRRPGWADAGVVVFWLSGLLALAGVFTARGRRMPLPVAAVPVLLYLSVVFTAFETPRYRTAIDPFILMLAAVALVAARDAVRSGCRGGTCASASLRVQRDVHGIIVRSTR